MGYIREPKNVDLVVGPSVFTDESRKSIAQAISRYKKTGKKSNYTDFAIHAKPHSVIKAKI